MKRALTPVCTRPIPVTHLQCTKVFMRDWSRVCSIASWLGRIRAVHSGVGIAVQLKTRPSSRGMCRNVGDSERNEHHTKQNL
jgi:hypothetical protein